MKEIKNNEIETIKVLGRVALWYLTPINKLITNRSILSSIKKKYFISYEENFKTFKRKKK